MAIVQFPATRFPFILRGSARLSRTLLAFLALSAFPSLCAAADEPADSSAAAAGENEPEKQIFRGQVVLLRDALKARGIASYEEMKDQVVLETPNGELIPIVADWRGRAFFQDERLRNRKVELLGHRKPGVPYLQVLVIYTFDESGRRQHTDYWCDICAIPMYEIKPCDCCQGKIELRFRPTEPAR